MVARGAAEADHGDLIQGKRGAFGNRVTQAAQVLRIPSAVQTATRDVCHGF